ncbi:MAG: elongation factor G [Clostridia bacterium]|nr:elongation factor G [Clostridia bacterium]
MAHATAVRNVALIGHGGTGKTSLAEALLFRTGATNRLGRVDDRTSLLDHDPDAQERRTTLALGLAPCAFAGTRLNLVDTPGYLDFAGEVRAALRVVESALLLVDAAAGVEVGTVLGWKAAEEAGRPRLLFVNRIDRENANFQRTLSALREAFGERVVPLAWPLGEAGAFRGVVDLVLRRAFSAAKGGEAAEPAEPPPEAADWHKALVEAAAESDDELLEAYLEAGELAPEDAWRGLARAVAEGRLAPVLVGSALGGVGLDLLLQSLRDLAPAPEATQAAGDGRFRGLVFKTVADPFVGKISLIRVYSGVLRPDSHVRNLNRGEDERVGALFRLRGKEQEPVDEARAGDIVAVAKLQHTATGDTLSDDPAAEPLPGIAFPRPVYPVAVRPRSKGDEEKIGAGLARLAEEDPTFVVERDAEMRQTVLSAMGDVHVEVICSRLRRKFGVEVEVGEPRVPYRETITRTARGEGKHKKQTGGHGQYGHCILEIAPGERGSGFAFEERIFGGAVPKQYIPAVEKGVVETMREGVLAGYPVVDVKVVLLDGSYHPVDSSELAFKIAASLAFKKAFAEAKPVLLEPVLELEILVPEACLGDVMSDLNRKRGRVLEIGSEAGMQRLVAHVPQAEANRYAIDLRSITQGRGLFTARFSHYDEAPPHVAQAVIQEAQSAEARAAR